MVLLCSDNRLCLFLRLNIAFMQRARKFSAIHQDADDVPIGLIPTTTPVRTFSFEQRSIPRADNWIREPMASFGLC